MVEGDGWERRSLTNAPCYLIQPLNFHQTQFKNYRVEKSWPECLSELSHEKAFPNMEPGGNYLSPWYCPNLQAQPWVATSIVLTSIRLLKELNVKCLAPGMWHSRCTINSCSHYYDLILCCKTQHQFFPDPSSHADKWGCAQPDESGSLSQSLALSSSPLGLVLGWRSLDPLFTGRTALPGSSFDLNGP